MRAVDACLLSGEDSATRQSLHSPPPLPLHSHLQAGVKGNKLSFLIARLEVLPPEALGLPDPGWPSDDPAAPGGARARRCELVVTRFAYHAYGMARDKARLEGLLGGGGGVVCGRVRRSEKEAGAVRVGSWAAGWVGGGSASGHVL